MASNVLQQYLENSFIALPELIRQQAQERVLRKLTDEQVAIDTPIILRELNDRIQAATDRLVRADERIKKAAAEVDMKERLVIELDNKRRIAHYERDKAAAAAADLAYVDAEKERIIARAEQRTSGVARGETEAHLAKLQAALAQLRAM